MPFSKERPDLAAAAGRAAQQRRWARSTPEQRQAAVATMTAGRRRKYLESAQETAERLGLTLSPEQVEQSATVLQRQDLRERLAKGREKQAEMRSHADAWVSKVHGLVTQFVDGLIGELGLTPEMQATVYRVSMNAFADETALPQEQRQWQRLRRRLESYRLYIHEQHCPEHRWPDAPCLTCGLAGVS